MNAAEFIALQNAQLAKIHRARLDLAREAHDLKPGAKPQPIIRNEPLVPQKAPRPNPRQRKVSVVSFRTRLLDPDNLCVKYFVDGLRYCGLLTDDSPEHISLTVSQVKVKTKAEERTEIEIN